MDLHPALTRSLEAQGFRRVPLDQLVAAPFVLPGAGPEVDAALTRAQDDPNWVEVVRQLAQLKLRGFWDLHLRLDKHDLEIVPVYAWKGELNIATVDSYMDFIYTVVSQIAGNLGKLKLDDTAVKALTLVLNTAGVKDTAKQVATLLIEANAATMPNTNVLFVDVDGISDDLRQRFEWNVQRVSANPFNFNRPWVYAYGVDGLTFQVAGVGDINTLNKGQLAQSLGFLALQ
ncbi:hypothetical protein [Microbacterium sp. PMB16]|uniref:hypothetical protein n=1 Tax=Microbacterium sp. PMB16 TaxID=3120157 RepID=UPI003F4C8D1D